MTTQKDFPFKSGDKITWKRLQVSEPDEIIKMINKFELKSGCRPAFILTTEDKRKVIMEWFGFTPKQIEESIGYTLKDIPVITPSDVMII